MTTLLPRSNHTRFYLRLTATLFAITVAVAPKAEELGHLRYHDSDYRHWKQPGTNISCCSDHDCAPVRAELRQGQWFALRHGDLYAELDEMGQGELLLWRSEWIAVPDERIILVPNPTVEGGHLCYSRGTVLCFVPPSTGG